MKRNTLIILLVVLVLALTIPAALAQGPTFPSQGVTGVQAVNLDTSAVQIQATYYATDGTPYTLIPVDLANQGDSHTYYAEPGGDDSTTQGTPATFSGAAILSADKQIAAIANTFFGSNNASGAYGGSNSGSTSVTLPLVLGNYYGQTSAIGIQNTDTANDVNVTVTFSPQGGASFTQQHTIKAGASKILDMGLDTTSFPELWIGSATVTPDDGTTPLVASAMIYTNNFVYAYTGFTNTGTEWFLPLIRSDYAGLSTGVQVVSVGTANTVVTINYAGATYNSSYQVTNSNYTCTVEATLTGGSSITFYNAGSWGLADVIGATDGAITGGTCATDGDLSFGVAGWFLGSATITTDGGQVAVMVNDANSAGTSSGAYNGFLASEAAASVISPLARVNLYGITSGTQIQNICGNSVEISSVYKTGNGSQNPTAPTVANQTLASLASYTYYIPTGGANDGWLGSLTVSTTDGSSCLVGITNDAPAGGDASVFNTFAMP